MQVLVLSEIKTILEDMRKISMILPYENVICRLPEKKNAFRQILQEDDSDLVTDNTLCEILKLSDKPGPLKRYANFCIFALSQMNGILLPANRSIGAIKFRESVFGLCHSRFSEFITKHPEQIKFDLIEWTRNNPEYILLLDLFNDVLTAKEDVEIRFKSSAQKKDYQTQTDLHPIASSLNKDYCWNIWDIHRKTLQLVTMIYLCS